MRSVERWLFQRQLLIFEKKFGGLGITELRRLRQLEEENFKLKQIVADLSLDKQVLQDVLKKILKSAAATRVCYVIDDQLCCIRAASLLCSADSSFCLALQIPQRQDDPVRRRLASHFRQRMAGVSRAPHSDPVCVRAGGWRDGAAMETSSCLWFPRSAF